MTSRAIDTDLFATKCTICRSARRASKFRYAVAHAGPLYAVACRAYNSVYTDRCERNQFAVIKGSIRRKVRDRDHSPLAAGCSPECYRPGPCAGRAVGLCARDGGRAPLADRVADLWRG